MQRRYAIDFPRYLAECEYNYRRLCRLLPSCADDATATGRQWSYMAGEQEAMHGRLVLRIEETTRYTTRVHISMETRLQKPGDWFKKSAAGEQNESSSSYGRDMSLGVRLYHDAKVAEVLDVAGYRRFLPRYTYPNPCMHQQDEKAQLNVFLGELLDHCLNTGRVDKQFSFSNNKVS